METRLRGVRSLLLDQGCQQAVHVPLQNFRLDACRTTPNGRMMLPRAATRHLAAMTYGITCRRAHVGFLKSMRLDRCRTERGSAVSVERDPDTGHIAALVRRWLAACIDVNCL